MSGSAVRETLATLGVIASLVFVGMEIRQNTAVARAEARQGLTENYLAFTMTLATDSAARNAWLQRFGADQPDPEELDGTGYMMWSMLRNAENVFLQFQEGVVDESVLASYGWTDNPVFRRQPFVEWWNARRQRFNADFAGAFEAEYDLAP